MGQTSTIGGRIVEQTMNDWFKYSSYDPSRTIVSKFDLETILLKYKFYVRKIIHILYLCKKQPGELWKVIRDLVKHEEENSSPDLKG